MYTTHSLFAQLPIPWGSGHCEGCGDPGHHQAHDSRVEGTAVSRVKGHSSGAVC